MYEDNAAVLESGTHSALFAFLPFTIFFVLFSLFFWEASLPISFMEIKAKKQSKQNLVQLYLPIHHNGLI